LKMSLVVLSTLLVTPLPAAGQLAEGARVRVTIAGKLADDGSVSQTSGSQSIVARFVAMEASDLILTVGDNSKSIRVPKAVVTGLEVRRRSRLKGGLIGAGIGGLVGIVVGLTAASSCASQEEFGCALPAIASMVVALPAGTLVGVVTGKPQWVQVSPMAFALSVTPAANGVRISSTLRF